MEKYIDPSCVQYEEPKHESIYNSVNVLEFDNKNVFYIGYIGRHDGIDLYKYGISKNVFKRHFYQHKNNFETFQPIFIREATNSSDIETMFKREIKARNLDVEIKANEEKTHIEIFTTDMHNNIESIMNIANNVIDSHPLKIVNDLK